MTLRKITDRDLQGYGVIGMADTPNLPARQMQEKVEEVVRSVVIPVMNENVDNTVSKQDLANIVLNSGAGDMLALYYDNNLDGIVNKADAADIAYNGFFTYSHSKVGTVHYLNGSGDNIKFIATADFNDGDAFMVGSEDYTAFLTNGDALPGGHFKAGYVVSCFKNGNCLNFNNGGAALNFKIAGGTIKPASPAENTIWVNTDIEISDWTLSADEPDYIADGGIWIETATAGNTLFNALKKNRLYIAPKKVWQRDGSNLDEKDMLVYIGGEWKRADEILFPYVLAFVTGGENSDSCEAAATYLRCEAKPTKTNGNCHSQTVIDCSNYSKLIFTVKSVSLPGNATATVGVHFSGAGTTSGGYTAYADVTHSGEYEVDITDVNQKLFVTVSVWSSDAEPEMTVTGITIM